MMGRVKKCSRGEDDHLRRKEKAVESTENVKELALWALKQHCNKFRVRGPPPNLHVISTLIVVYSFFRVKFLTPIQAKRCQRKQLCTPICLFSDKEFLDAA